MDESKIDESIQVPRRRRSSILNRRSYAPPIVEPQPTSDKVTKTSEIAEAPENETLKLKPAFSVDAILDENFLTSRVKDLTSEKTAWKSLMSERKSQKRALSRNAAPSQLSWETAKDFLSEEDIAFLKYDPPYEKIYDDSERVVKKAALLRVKYDRCSNLASGIQRVIKSRLDNIKENIGRYSEKNLDLPEPTEIPIKG